MADPLGGGNGMVPHYSGTTLDAQTRYAGGAKGIIGRYFAGEAQNPANLIVIDGDYASKSYCQRAAKKKEQSQRRLLSRGALLNSIINRRRNRKLVRNICRMECIS